MEHDPAHQLNIKNPFPQSPASRLSNQGEGFRQQRIQGFTVLVAFPVLRRFFLELLRTEGEHLGFHRVDLPNQRSQSFQIPFTLRSQDLGENVFSHAFNVAFRGSPVKDR